MDGSTCYHIQQCSGVCSVISRRDCLSCSGWCVAVSMAMTWRQQQYTLLNDKEQKDATKNIKPNQSMVCVIVRIDCM